jgi:extradiol dioxygenase family protein
MISTDDRFYCGLLPTFIIDPNVNFQLEVGENKDVFFYPPKLTNSMNKSWRLMNSWLRTPAGN